MTRYVMGRVKRRYVYPPEAQKIMRDTVALDPELIKALVVKALKDGETTPQRPDQDDIDRRYFPDGWDRDWPARPPSRPLRAKGE